MLLRWRAGRKDGVGRCRWIVLNVSSQVHLRGADYAKIKIKIKNLKIKSVCLGADCFAFGELLGKAPQVTKGACSWFGPPASGSLTPVLLRGPAPNGHPCPDGALAASMPLGPLRKTCVQPAPKSRLAVTELFVYEDQKQIKSRSKAD